MDISIFNKIYPIFYIHSSEPYFPTDMADYVAGSDLYHNGKKIDKPDTLPTTGDGYELILTDRSMVPGNKNALMTGVSKPPFKNYPPIYVVTNKIVYNGVKYTDYVFIVTYAYNGTLDYHDFDSEYVTIRLDDKTGKITKIYGSQHGGGVWYNPKDFEWDGTHPIIYIANESHAHYNKAGEYGRLWGFGNDYTNKGYYWNPRVFQVLPNDVKDLPKALDYLNFVGHRSVDSSQGFPPYRQTTPANSLMYDAPDKDMDLIANALGADTVSDLYTGLSILSLILVFIVLLLGGYLLRGKRKLLFTGYTLSIIILFLSLLVMYTLGIFDDKLGFGFSSTK
jgi:hypothetical protein